MARSGDLGARKEGMLDAVQTLRATDTGITAITSLLEQAKGIATSALGTYNTDTRASYATQYNNLMSQVVKIAKDASYKGTNLLNNNTLTVKFNEKGDSSININGFTATTLNNLTLAFVGSGDTSGIGYNSSTSKITSFGGGSGWSVTLPPSIPNQTFFQSFQMAMFQHVVFTLGNTSYHGSYPPIPDNDSIWPPQAFGQGQSLIFGLVLQLFRILHPHNGKHFGDLPLQVVRQN